MSELGKEFAFDENDAFDANLLRFEDRLVQTDTALGAELKRHLPELNSGIYTTGKIWDALFAISEACPVSGPLGGLQPATSAILSSSAAAPTASKTPITGWLLTGVAIEGFRGINNERKPLELKFQPDKVNSISAVNGVGKSSVYDAIRYAISGRLQWIDDLPATERESDYYLNRFNSSGKATIKLKLLAEPTGDTCEVTVIRDSSGKRRVSATHPWDGEAVLRSLDREFVLLDSSTFAYFISAKPLDRGRTFSGLLGLSDYSKLRQNLAALAHTRAFGNHFALAAHAQAKARDDKAIKDAQSALGRDYAILVGTPLGSLDAIQAQSKCHQALAQIGPLTSLCAGNSFGDLEIEACIEAVKQAEGGPKRDQLATCIRERAMIAKFIGEAPTTERAIQLVSRAKARETALALTAGNVMLALFQAGAEALDEAHWSDPFHCPLCDSKTAHDLRGHVGTRLAEFTALEEATQAIAIEWNDGGWANLKSLEAALEATIDAHLIAKLQDRSEIGTITVQEAQSLASWLETLRARANNRESELRAVQTALEQELPQSSVEVTTKVETARRLQESWRKLEEAEALAQLELSHEAQVHRVKTFLDTASADFGLAEAAISKARLAAVEPVFKSYFDKLSCFGVVPAVSKRATGEELQLRLSEFHGLTNLSPQALLSESFRNALAIALYLAAASLYGGLPKFVILDDVTSSFDAGHQNFLVELLRTTFARPGNPTGPQVILLSHDTMLEKLFNKHSNSGAWWHQRLEGTPQLAVLPQAGAVNKVRDQTMSMLQAGQVDFAKEGVRQYLEYRLSDLISRLRIPVPVDVAFNDNKQLAGEFLNAIEAAVKLHQAAGTLVLEPPQVSGLNATMVTIVGNFLSHWGTGQTLSFTGASLMGVMLAIDSYCDCFTFEPTPGAPRVFYRTLHQRH